MPAIEQVAAWAGASSGVVSSSGRRLRSETTRPLAIRSPLPRPPRTARLGAPRSASRTRARTSCRCAPGVHEALGRTACVAGSAIFASSGSVRCASQSSSCRPIAPMTAICGKWTWVSTRPGNRKQSRRSMSSAWGFARRDVRERAGGQDRAVGEGDGAVSNVSSGVLRERVARRVGDAGAQDRGPAHRRSLDFGHGRHRRFFLRHRPRARREGRRAAARHARFGDEGRGAARDRRRAGRARRRRSSRPTRAIWRPAARPGSRRALMDRLALDPDRLRGSPTARGRSPRCPIPSARSSTAAACPTGWTCRKVRVPFGVVAVVYEARPNVTIDAAALCLKSGNAVAAARLLVAPRTPTPCSRGSRARRSSAPACPTARSALVAGGGREELPSSPRRTASST